MRCRRLSGNLSMAADGYARRRDQVLCTPFTPLAPWLFALDAYRILTERRTPGPDQDTWTEIRKMGEPNIGSGGTCIPPKFVSCLFALGVDNIHMPPPVAGYAQAWTVDFISRCNICLMQDGTNHDRSCPLSLKRKESLASELTRISI